MAPLHETLPELVPALTADLMRYLSIHFPRACQGEREDAAQEALLHLAREAVSPGSLTLQAWERDGAGGVRRLANVVAWRSLRGHYRRMGRSWSPLEESLIGGARPDDLLVARRAAERLPAILSEAAPRFAARAPDALQAALLESLTGGEPDAVVSARHGLRREPLCRARRWIQEQIAA